MGFGGILIFYYGSIDLSFSLIGSPLASAIDCCFGSCLGLLCDAGFQRLWALNASSTGQVDHIGIHIHFLLFSHILFCSASRTITNCCLLFQSKLINAMSDFDQLYIQAFVECIKAIICCIVFPILYIMPKISFFICHMIWDPD